MVSQSCIFNEKRVFLSNRGKAETKFIVFSEKSENIDL
jgi:hypothetical protein